MKLPRRRKVAKFMSHFFFSAPLRLRGKKKFY